MTNSEVPCGNPSATDSLRGASATADSPRGTSVLVSIISYRTARRVGRCLASMVEEHKRAMDAGIDVKVVVVDNASGDTPELERTVKELGIESWVSVVTAQRNGGFAYGNNLVLRHGYESDSVPDYFWLLNPDTEVRPHAIAELVGFLRNHPRVGIAGSSLEAASGESWPYAFRFPTLLSELDSALRLGPVTRLLENHAVLREMTNVPEQVDWMPGASMMLRRELVDAIGGLDESYFLYYEETDYCRRVVEAGWSSWYVPSSRVMHDAGGSTGVTTRRERAQRFPAYWYESRRRYFQKNFGLRYAAVTDAICASALLLGNLKQIALGRARTNVPHRIRDILRHSVLLPKNRRLDPTVKFEPSAVRTPSAKP